MTDLTRAQWRKASRSGTANGGCVEVAGNLPGVTAIRTRSGRKTGRMSWTGPRSPRSWLMSGLAVTTADVPARQTHAGHVACCLTR